MGGLLLTSEGTHKEDSSQATVGRRPPSGPLWVCKSTKKDGFFFSCHLGPPELGNLTIKCWRLSRWYALPKGIYSQAPAKKIEELLRWLLLKQKSEGRRVPPRSRCWCACCRCNRAPEPTRRGRGRYPWRQVLAGLSLHFITTSAPVAQWSLKNCAITSSPRLPKRHRSLLKGSGYFAS